MWQSLLLIILATSISTYCCLYSTAGPLVLYNHNLSFVTSFIRFISLLIQMPVQGLELRLFSHINGESNFLALLLLFLLCFFFFLARECGKDNYGRKDFSTTIRELLCQAKWYMVRKDFNLYNFYTLFFYSISARRCEFAILFSISLLCLLFIRVCAHVVVATATASASAIVLDFVAFPYYLAFYINEQVVIFVVVCMR